MRQQNINILNYPDNPRKLKGVAYMRFKVLLIAIFIITATASGSVGYLFGSNMGSYPSFYGREPHEPIIIDNLYIPMYVEDAKRYVEQGKEYVDNCNNDIETIEEARNNVADEINRFIKRHNMFMSSLNY